MLGGVFPFGGGMVRHTSSETPIKVYFWWPTGWCGSRSHGPSERTKGAEPTARPKPLLFGMEENPISFLEAVRLGACGYLLNDASSSEVVAAIRAVAGGDAVCPPRLCTRLFEHASRNTPRRWKKTSWAGACRPNLPSTPVDATVAKGMTNKEIATNLKVSEFTVKNHLSRIMGQLRAETRHHAVDEMRAGG